MTKYIDQERARYWPVSRKLMAQYRDGTHTIKDKYGDFYWLKNKRKHRECDVYVYWSNVDQFHRDDDKPAVIDADGGLQWWQNGRLHRDGDKPASIGADGTLEWWQNGQCHRLCGPAVIRPNGKIEWWINGEEITQEVKKWLIRKRWGGTTEQIVEFQLRFG